MPSSIPSYGCTLRILLAVSLSAVILAGCADDASRLSSAAEPPTKANPATSIPVTRADLATLPPVETTQASVAPAAADTGKPLRIGLLLPLGGFDQTAAIAKGMKQAAELALFEADRPNIQLVVKDDKGTPEGARAAAEDAVKDGAEIILGPLFGRAVSGAAPVARAASVPLLAFSNDRQVAGNGVYALGFLPEPEVDRIVVYAASQNKRRFAALVPDDGYGQIVGAAFRDAVARSGGMVASFEVYPAGANAMLMPSRRVVEAVKTSAAAGTPIDAVFVPGGQDVLPQLGPLMTYAGFDNGKVKLLGSGAWEFANIGNNDAFVGGWYPGPDPQGWRAFSSRFAKAFGQPPPRLASMAYDAVNLAIALSSAPAGSQRFAASSLTRPSGFAGVDGLLRLRADGLSERALAVLEVQRIGSTVVEAAPASLDGANVSAARPPHVN